MTKNSGTGHTPMRNCDNIQARYDVDHHHVCSGSGCWGWSSECWGSGSPCDWQPWWPLNPAIYIYNFNDQRWGFGTLYSKSGLFRPNADIQKSFAVSSVQTNFVMEKNLTEKFILQ